MCVCNIRGLEYAAVFDAQSPPPRKTPQAQREESMTMTILINLINYTSMTSGSMKIYCPSSWTIMDSCPMIPTIFRFTVLRSLRLRSLAIQTWGSNRPEKNVAIVEFCDCFGLRFGWGCFGGKVPAPYHGIHPWEMNRGRAEFHLLRSWNPWRDSKKHQITGEPFTFDLE